MAKANPDILGAVGQVAAGSSEKTMTFTVKEFRNFLIIGGAILVLISAVAVFALVGGKSKDVAGPESVNGEIIKTPAGATLVPGPFSQQAIQDMAVDCTRAALKNKIIIENIQRKTNFFDSLCSVKCVAKEKGKDKNGVERDIYIVESHLVGEYIAFRGDKQPLDVSLVIHVIKVDYGAGYKILSYDVTDIQA